MTERPLYTVVEYDLLKYPHRTEKYDVRKFYQWDHTTGIGWMHRGEPCRYGEAKRRVSVLNNQGK